jgi:putative ABC transport system ATP-binding protein
MSQNNNQAQLAIQAINLCKTVRLPDQELHVLEDVRLEVPDGSTCAIVGRSGSGKTSLLGILAGLDVPTTGECRIFDQLLSDMSEDQRAEVREQSVGFVFQSFHLIEHLNALQNVMLPMQLKGMKGAESSARDYLKRLGLEHRMLHMPKQLSGGEQQRVAIARAFACRPRVLFADEPTGNLDADTGDEIVKSLFDLNAEQGTTLVLVTHDQELAKRCDHVLTLEHGRIVE